MKKTRIVVVGAAWYGDWAKSFYQSLLRLGFSASIVYNNSVPAPLGGGNDVVTSFFEKSKRLVKSIFGQKFFRFLKAVRTRFSEYEILLRVGWPAPTETVIVIFVWTPGSVWVLNKLKKKGIQLVLWIGEPPIREKWWETTYAYFDHLYIVDEGMWMDELPPEEKKRVRLLPLSSDDAIFHPLAQTTGVYAADISFVGQYIGSRAETLAHFTEYDLKIYGFGWEKGFEEFPYLKKHYHGSLPTSALNEVYNGTKIVVGTLGTLRELHTTATMRTFDIALAGSFQISQDVALTKKLFGDSIAYFKNNDDLERLVAYYLSNETDRRERAARSREVALRYTYREAAKTILSACGVRVEE